jgi:hypothetical protein
MEIHKVACDLLQHKAPRPIFQITEAPDVNMAVDSEGRININFRKMEEDFLVFKSNLEAYKPTLEEFVVYHLEDEWCIMFIFLLILLCMSLIKIYCC